MSVLRVFDLSSRGSEPASRGPPHLTATNRSERLPETLDSFVRNQIPQTGQGHWRDMIISHEMITPRMQCKIVSNRDVDTAACRRRPCSSSRRSCAVCRLKAPLASNSPNREIGIWAATSRPYLTIHESPAGDQTRPNAFSGC